MKEFFKKLIGIRGTIFINHLLNRDFSPMSLGSKLMPKESYSDFFFYCPLFFQNSYRAENTLSFLLKRPINVNHVFVFYSQDGVKFKEISFKSSDLIISIDFPKFKTKDKYLSFTHEIIPIQKELKIKNIIGQNDLVSLQHRGYSIFKKKYNSLGTIVHGNFGVICPSDINKSAAKQRNIEFSYTPTYEFEYDSYYELLFNNPTSKILEIKVFFKNANLNYSIEKIFIKPLGTSYINFKNYKGQISFNSKLPICRPLIFKNPNIESNNFDVFHS